MGHPWQPVRLNDPRASIAGLRGNLHKPGFCLLLIVVVYFVYFTLDCP